MGDHEFYSRVSHVSRMSDFGSVPQLKPLHKIVVTGKIGGGGYVDEFASLSFVKIIKVDTNK